MNAIVKTIELTMTTSLWDSYIMPARPLHGSAQHPLFQRDDVFAVDGSGKFHTSHQEMKEQYCRLPVLTDIDDEEGLTGFDDMDSMVTVESHSVTSGPELTRCGNPQVTPIRRGTRGT